MWAPRVLKRPGGPSRPPSAHPPQHPGSKLAPLQLQVTPLPCFPVRSGFQNLRGLTKKSQTQNLCREGFPVSSARPLCPLWWRAGPVSSHGSTWSSLCHPERSEGQTPVLQGRRPSEGSPQSRRPEVSRDRRQGTPHHPEQTAGSRGSTQQALSPPCGSAAALGPGCLCPAGASPAETEGLWEGSRTWAVSVYLFFSFFQQSQLTPAMNYEDLVHYAC